MGTEKLLPPGPWPSSKGKEAGGALWATAATENADITETTAIDLSATLCRKNTPDRNTRADGLAQGLAHGLAAFSSVCNLIPGLV